MKHVASSEREVNKEIQRNDWFIASMKGSLPRSLRLKRGSLPRFVCNPQISITRVPFDLPTCVIITKTTCPQEYTYIKQYVNLQ